MNKKENGYLFAFSCYFLWGLLPIFWKTLDTLNSVYIISARVFFSFILIVILLLTLNKKDELLLVIKRPKKVLLAILAGVFVALNWLTFIIAVNSEHTITAALGYFINPLAIVLAGTLIFKEKLNIYSKVALLLAIIGVAVSSILFGEFPKVSIILALTFTAYGITKKINGIDSFVSLFIETLILLPFAIYIMIHFELNGTGAFASGNTTLIICTLLTGIVTLIPLILYSKAVSLIPFNTVGFFQYITPTLMLAIGLFVYKETISTGQLVCFGFVWVSLIIYIYSLIKKDI